MKFVSKSSNLLVVLRPGMSAQPLTGTPAKATISVRFKDGIAEVQDEGLVKMMLEHTGFNSDFISAEDMVVDPYLSMRQQSEPDHIVTEMKYGMPVNRTVPKTQLPPDIQKLVQTAAIEMAKEMLPSMVENTLKSILASSQSNKEKTPKKVGRKPGRKAKNKVKVEVGAEESEPVNTVQEVNPGIQESVSGE
jgi:hypothetical protein